MKIAKLNIMSNKFIEEAYMYVMFGIFFFFATKQYSLYQCCHDWTMDNGQHWTKNAVHCSLIKQWTYNISVHCCPLYLLKFINIQLIKKIKIY